MTNWKPIKTAPKDGTQIDVWVTGSSYENGGWRWTNVQWTDDGWSDEFNNIHDLEHRLSDVTHWMPHPVAPHDERADLTPSPEVVKELVEALRGAADAISLALNDEAIGDGRLKAALTDAGIDARKQIEKWG